MWSVISAFLRTVAIIFAIILTSCSDGGKWSREERVNAQGVPNAMVALTAATIIENNLTEEVNHINKIQIIGSLMTALSAAKSVNDNVLDKIHANIRTHWRNELELGLELRLKNLESEFGDLKSEFEGAAKLDRFGFWWNANRSDLKIPKI